MEVDPRVQAHAYLAAGNPRKAGELLRAALALQPTDGLALLLLAQAEVQLGNLAEAERCARAATADAEVRADAFDQLARVLGLDEKRAREAVEAAGTAVRLEPDDWRHRATLALALADVREMDTAIEQAGAALQLAPPDPPERARALVTLSRVYLASRANRELGYRVMRDAAALDPTDLGLQQQVMMAQFQSGRRAEAIATALSTLRSAPRSAVPPLIARFSVYLLTRRVTGWLLLVSFLVPLLGIGIIGSTGDPSLLERFPDAVIRIAAAVGLAGFALVGALTLRPLADPAIARAVWRFARRSALFWLAVVPIALSLVSYLVALALGAAFFPGVPLPFLLMLLSRIVHGWGGLALKAPDAASLLAQQSR